MVGLRAYHQSLGDICSDKWNGTRCKEDIDDDGIAIGDLPNPRYVACNGIP